MEQFRKDFKLISDLIKSHLFTLLVIVVLFLGSAILISIYKNPSLNYPSDPNSADKIFYYLNEWASAIAPLFALLGIIVVLVISIKSLRQTASIQRKVINEKHLNEIIKWAEDLCESISCDNIDSLCKRYNNLNRKSKFLKSIVSQDFDVKLNTAIDKVIQQLDKNIEDCINLNKEENINKIQINKEDLCKFSELLIKEAYATKVKETVDSNMEEKQLDKKDDLKEPSLHEIKKLIVDYQKEMKEEFERARKKSYATGIYLGGVSMLAVGFANLIADNSREFFSTPTYTIIFSVVLLAIGTFFMKKAKEK